jgi:hypothetical protein
MARRLTTNQEIAGSTPASVNNFLLFVLLLNYPNSSDLITNLNNDGLVNAAGAFLFHHTEKTQCKHR